VKRLLILRHAKSSWADSSITDWHRPLNERGLRDAPRAGTWLRGRSLVPDVVITSDAVRARSRRAQRRCGLRNWLIHARDRQLRAEA
jgi:phosphohistidine phosphatase